MQNLAAETQQERETAIEADDSCNEELVSFVQEIPMYLKNAMSSFIEEHPNWDQYRLMQAAISGYLLQKGIQSREINRIYSESMFCKKAFGTGL